MIVANNTAAIKAQGGFLCGDDDFEIVWCVQCRTQYLYNEEILQLYLDPSDLSQKVLDYMGAEPQTCRGCGARPLDWEEIPEERLDVVLTGPWAWAL